VSVSESAAEGFVGRTLDNRWLIEELIGKGGMGFVFQGRQLSVERSIAIKLIRNDVAKEPRLVSRFFREAKVLSGLQHPNIVTMLDFGQDEETGALYLVMELLRGRALSSYVEAGDKFSLREILQIVEQLMSALAEAHDGGVVHRDMKPENLFVDRLPGGGVQVKLIDFGIARVDEPQITRLTQTGCLQGTPHFMAPEQIEGRPSSPQTDLYAAGVIVYELLSGKQPFVGNTLMAVLMQHLQKEPDPLDAGWHIDDPLEPKVSRLVHDLLQKDPAARPATASEVGRRAHRILAELELARFRTEEFAAGQEGLDREPVKFDGPALEAAELAPRPEAAKVKPAAPAAPDAIGRTMDDWAVDPDGDDLEDGSDLPPPPGIAKVAIIAAAVVLGALLIGLVGYVVMRDDTPARAGGETLTVDREDVGVAPHAPDGAAEVAEAPPPTAEDTDAGDVAGDAGALGAAGVDGASRDGASGDALGPHAPASARRRRSSAELEKVLEQMRQP